MRYEIMHIFTLLGNDLHCRSEERSDVLGAVAACGLRILSAELGTRTPCGKGDGLPRPSGSQ